MKLLVKNQNAINAQAGDVQGRVGTYEDAAERPDLLEEPLGQLIMDSELNFEATGMIVGDSMRVSDVLFMSDEPAVGTPAGSASENEEDAVSTDIFCSKCGGGHHLPRAQAEAFAAAGVDFICGVVRAAGCFSHLRRRR